MAARALLGGGWSRTAAIIGAASAVGAAELYGFAIPDLGDDGRRAGVPHPVRAVQVRYRRDAGLVVRLDPRRYQERNQLKLSLLDLPLLPEQLREMLPENLLRQLNRRELPPPR